MSRLTKSRLPLTRFSAARIVGAVVFASALLAACGGDSDSPGTDTTVAAVTETSAEAPTETEATEATDTAASDAAATDTAVTDTEATEAEATEEAASSGKVDCAFLRDPVSEQALFGLQLIPQIRSQSLIDNMRTGVLNFKTADLARYLDALTPLGGTSYPPFGDPAEAIALYKASNAKVQELVDIDGPVPQAKFDELAAIVGDLASFLKGQVAIGAALDEVCPK